MLVALIAVVVIAAAGFGAYRLHPWHQNKSVKVAVTQPATPTPSPTPPLPSPAPTTDSPSPQSPARPTAPDDALALTDQQATDELTLESTEDGPALAPLAGGWVPQVSNKCVGVQVDIGPNWIPDGQDDTAHVTIQQILGFQLSLHARFGALTVRPTQLGVASDQATSGPCAHLTIWGSVVPQRFSSAGQANAWCNANVPPVRECDARYVARPGERSTQVERS